MKETLAVSVSFHKDLSFIEQCQNPCVQQLHSHKIMLLKVVRLNQKSKV